MEKRLITTQEAAEILCCSAKHIGVMRAAKKISGIKVANRWMYGYEEIEAYRQSHMRQFLLNQERQLRRKAEAERIEKQEEEVFEISDELARLFEMAWEIWFTNVLNDAGVLSSMEYLRLKEAVRKRYL